MLSKNIKEIKRDYKISENKIKSFEEKLYNY